MRYLPRPTLEKWGQLRWTALRRWVSFSLLLPVLGCASDKALVENSAASYIYHEAAYEWKCVEVKGPPSCAKYEDLLIQTEKRIRVANEAYKVGKLPPDEVKELEDLQQQLMRLP